MEYYCQTCGKELDCEKSGECYSDNPNALTHGHLGGIQCRECFGNSHDFCSKCENTPLIKEWKFCPKCGSKKSNKKEYLFFNNIREAIAAIKGKEL